MRQEVKSLLNVYNSSLTHYLSLVPSHHPVFIYFTTLFCSSLLPPSILPPSHHFHFFSFIISSFDPSALPPIPFLLFLSLPSGLTKDGSGSANAESLEEVLNILAEEGSDWIYGFFTFLYDVVSSPLEPGEEEEAAASEMMEEEEEGGTASSDDGEVKGVILDLQNQ